MQETWDREGPLEEEWQPAPAFLPGEPHGQRSLAGYSLWGRKESDMTERLTLSLFQTGDTPDVLQWVDGQKPHSHRGTLLSRKQEESASSTSASWSHWLPGRHPRAGAGSLRFLTKTPKCSGSLPWPVPALPTAGHPVGAGKRGCREETAALLHQCPGLLRPWVSPDRHGVASLSTPDPSTPKRALGLHPAFLLMVGGGLMYQAARH